MTKSLISLLIIGLATVTAAHTQDRMESIDAYLLEEAHELALAKSAAPATVSEAAALMVLTRSGYRQVRGGTNGFVCLVNRGWQAAPHPLFWSPKTLAPVCHNAHAAKAILPYHLRRTELALAGKSMQAVDSLAKAMFEIGEIPWPGDRSFSYMVSLAGYVVLPDYEGPVPPHVMVWMPNATQTDLGNNELFTRAPFVLGAGTRLAVAIIPVDKGVEPEM